MGPCQTWVSSFTGQELRLPLTQIFSFVLQLISLAGLHSTATITNELSRAYKTDGMLAYVKLVQSRERELGVDVLTHQKWSGAPYIDGILGAIQSGSSGSRSMGEGNTEKGKQIGSQDLSTANTLPRLLANAGVTLAVQYNLRLTFHNERLITASRTLRA